MNQEIQGQRVQTGIWILLLAAISGGGLLYATMLSTRVGGELACSLPGICESGSLVENSIRIFADWASFPISLLSWSFILIPTAYAAWYFRRSKRLFLTLVTAMVLFSAALWIRQSGNSGFQALIAMGSGLGLALGGQTIVVVALAWMVLADQKRRTGNLVQTPSLRMKRLQRLMIWVLLTITFSLVSGALLSMSPNVEGCIAGSLCGILGAEQLTLSWIHIGHWALVGIAGLLVLWLTSEAWRKYSHLVVVLVPITSLAILYFTQVVIGGISGIQSGGQPILDGLHSLASTGVWCLAIFAAYQIISNPKLVNASVIERSAPAGGTGKDYLLLTKPIIVGLLLVTTYAGMVVARGELPGASVTFWTLVAGAFAAGGSGAINQYIDRDRDRLMTRTAKRPIASGRLSPAEGLAFGVALCLASFFLMAVFVNILAAILSLIGIIYYVYLYSILLKNATVQNIVIGGGAGAIPPLVGWAAVTGNLTVAAMMLFVVIFMWTPPHFWALALVRRKDYARARVPMLPVVRGEKETRKQVFIYTLILVAITLTLPFFNLGGLIYIAGAILLGIWLINTAWRVLKIGGNKVAWKMYRYSSMYLAFLFLALVVDSLAL